MALKRRDVFFGKDETLEMLKSGKSIDKIFILRGKHGGEYSEIREICKKRVIPINIVPKEKINYLLNPLMPGGFINHQGVMGIYSPIDFANIDDVLHSVIYKGRDVLFVLLDNVTDVRNVGAIARSALAFGADALIVPLKGSAQINHESVKASANTLKDMTICRTESLESAIEFLKLNGIAIIGSSLHSKTPIQEVNFRKPMALVMGSEGDGMGAVIGSKCDEKFIVPMSGKIDSLNVSVSCGVMLYEIFNQRNAKF
jgi:23S rRNA (guanosine2251-2'-O)-methyltransferase